MKIEEVLNDQFDENLDDKYKSKFSEKVVLLTGAAGSIGQKLAMLLLQTAIDTLVLVDNSEANLYDLEQTLLLKGYKRFKIELSDVSCKLEVERLFKKYKPHIVYHAAAYKHVPLLEEFPHTAFQINTIGTKNIVDHAIKFKTEDFILVSTDKAVYPKSVMGLTKRMAEIYVGQWFKKSDTRIKIIRFGNIPNTAGSVLPLWKKQLELTNSIQVVHEKMFRYFVSINHVCQMLLEVGQERIGTLFISRMGEEININELAILFLKQNQLNANSISYTTKRPGEKEEEVLTYSEENLINNHELSYYSSNLKLNKNSILLLNELLMNYKKLHKKELKIAFNKIVSEYEGYQ